MSSEVCVIGCNGFVGSNVTKELMARGYSVRGTVRDASSETERWLRDYVSTAIGENRKFTIHTADPHNAASLTEVMQGCVGVISCAGTTERKLETVDAMRSIGRNVCIAAIDAGVPVAVFTSSTGSTNPPEGEPKLKNEMEHWSDPDLQLAAEKFPAAAKTVYDRTILRHMEQSGGKLRCVTINPSMIVGPNPRPEPDGSLKLFKRLLNDNAFSNGPPNSSMSLVHVQDLARLHIAALETPSARGRYFGLKKSWHWKDILQALGEIVDSFSPPEYSDEVELVRPTQFDFSRRDSLGVELRDLPEILKGGVDELNRRGLI